MLSVDIRSWQRDEEFYPFPEGARDKYPVIAPESPAVEAIVPAHRYLFKFSNPRYPVQFWSEIIGWIIGSFIDVPVPPCYYAEDPESGLPGSLIEWFYGEPIERNAPVPKAFSRDPSHDEAFQAPSKAPLTHSLYVPGSSYMVRRIEGYDLKTGKQHNLRDLGYLITFLRQRFGVDYWPFWARTFVFDFLIGNTDRHQDNWGVLWRSSSDGTLFPRFAPAFDNGTSLLHEIMEERLGMFDDEFKIDRYIHRGKHHIRMLIDDPQKAGHLLLVNSLWELRPTLRPIISQMVNCDLSPMFDQLQSLCDFQSPVPLSDIRVAAICKVVARRQELLKLSVESVQ